ncbi:hypothetical protein V8C37DRAFT_121575 [Trichoderma ceciliae]
MDVEVGKEERAASIFVLYLPKVFIYLLTLLPTKVSAMMPLSATAPNQNLSMACFTHPTMTKNSLTGDGAFAYCSFLFSGFLFFFFPPLIFVRKWTQNLIQRVFFGRVGRFAGVVLA